MKAGRGGAGNFYTKQELQDAAQASAEVLAYSLSLRIVPYQAQTTDVQLLLSHFIFEPAQYFSCFIPKGR